ncbi:LTA synthase family protein [Allochromatium palmeri]|uniref:Sulfatase-like hydrolase/transferase n=1 Tax=Allochromatium palmeri TaxID=231048 RepID=A0A6N8E9P0_9GAMM|nr:LTA synthase family protein [Allochromatium palmeri]MTW21002.1 sulfatase-like hydrolase/transferase [Allochromatium palmeri]
MTSVPSFVRAHSRALAWCAAFLFVLVWHALAIWASGYFLQVKPWASAYARDLIAHLLLGAVLFAIARSLTRFMIAATVVFGVLTFGNAMKLSTLGAPVMPDDFAAARNMFLLLDGWSLVAAVLLVAVPTLLLVWSIDWQRRWTWATLALIGAAIGLVVSFPADLVRLMDQHFGHSVWNQPANYQSRGLPIHLLQETTRALARRVPPPTAPEVEQARRVVAGERADEFVKVTQNTADASLAPPTRNLHMIVLESFWDPMALTASRLSADPLDPEFRRLWAQAGHSHLLAPVFGGYTANTEFEVLCGFPVTAHNVFFETGLKRDVPCLPGHLREAGYHSLASHPNAASFWNRVNVYRRIGFETYWADNDFVLDDMNRTFLSDASFYRQVMERLGETPGSPRPLFNYMLTYFGHLPYPLNERRPAVITAAEGHEVVAAYANTLYYKSRELMAFLRELRAADPDALIVLFGDHLPALTPNFGGYTESGLLAKQRGEFTDPMFRTLVETPLILIDGRRGPVAIGDIPAYQLPARLLERLGDQQPGILGLAAQERAFGRIRPLPGMHFVIADDADAAQVCRGAATDAAECADALRWIQAVETLRTDLFSGEQHTLLELHLPNRRFRAALTQSSASASLNLP